MSRIEVRERKVQAVIRWLEDTGCDEECYREVAVTRHRDLVIIAQAFGVDGITSVEVFTEARVAKWFDESAVRMRSHGLTWEEALGESWPTDDDAASADDDAMSGDAVQQLA